MGFTDEIKWTSTDFGIAGTILFVMGLFIEFILRKVEIRKYRIPLIIIILLAVLIVWFEFSVGLFGTLFSGS